MQYESYTPDEIQFIEANYNQMTHQQIGKKLGRSSGSITIFCWRKGPLKQGPMSRWTPDEIEYLKQNANKLHLTTLASHLGRSKYGVKDKITQLKLKKQKQNLPAKIHASERTIIQVGNKTIHRLR